MVENGQEAVDRIFEKPGQYGLVFLDKMMPVMVSFVIHLIVFHRVVGLFYHPHHSSNFFSSTTANLEWFGCNDRSAG